MSTKEKELEQKGTCSESQCSTESAKQKNDEAAKAVKPTEATKPAEKSEKKSGGCCGG